MFRLFVEFFYDNTHKVSLRRHHRTHGTIVRQTGRIPFAIEFFHIVTGGEKSKKKGIEAERAKKRERAKKMETAREERKKKAKKERKKENPVKGPRNPIRCARY